MRLFNTIVLTTAAVALIACSSKTKKPQTVSTDKSSTTTTTSGDTTKSKTDLDTNETTPDAKSKADLGQVIYFEFDSSTLADEARSTLDNNVTWLKEDKARVLTIEGHTDETGTSEYNMGLGQRRAASARKYLLSMGVDSSRIKVITYGEEKPASKTASQNRRSVFVATKKKK